MKKFLLFFGVFALALVLTACKIETSTNFGLDIEKATFALVNEDGSLNPVDDPTFKRGDKVAYVLLNVSGFKRGADNLNSFDMDMLVTGPNDEVILDQKSMLGENGHLDLPNDTAESPYGIFTSSEALTAGEYSIKLTVTDKVDNGSATRSSTFNLQ